jgi:succinate-semialdehyde dehydrogenase/glutarate-semialdehyde dehydrogenase/aspartate-semialdehyde dehydrogenase
MGQAARTIKRVSLELGGHAPFIVFDDSPLLDAVAGCMAAKFATSGQDCLAANRIFVQRRSYEAFCDAFAEQINRLKIGHGLEQHVNIGPMTRPAGVQKCKEQIQDAVEHGARIRAQVQSDDYGPNFVTPTLLVDVTDEMAIARDETFGPVAAVLPFDDEAEVIERANNSEMGLAAYVFTQSLNRATRTSQQLQYGMVGVNTASFTGPPVPFGGWKQSGIGREGSKHGLAEFMELKYTCIGGLSI